MAPKSSYFNFNLSIVVMDLKSKRKSHPNYNMKANARSQEVMKGVLDLMDKSDFFCTVCVEAFDDVEVCFPLLLSHISGDVSHDFSFPLPGFAAAPNRGETRLHG